MALIKRETLSEDSGNYATATTKYGSTPTNNNNNNNNNGYNTNNNNIPYNNNNNNWPIANNNNNNGYNTNNNGYNNNAPSYLPIDIGDQGGKMNAKVVIIVVSVICGVGLLAEH